MNDRKPFTVRERVMEAILRECCLEMRQYLDAAAIERECLADVSGASIGRMLGFFAS